MKKQQPKKFRKVVERKKGYCGLWTVLISGGVTIIWLVVSIYSYMNYLIGVVTGGMLINTLHVVDDYLKGRIVYYEEINDQDG